MKALIQRIKRASVTVDGEKISEIGKGILVFLGVEKDDEKENAEKLADKIYKLRIFEDENDKMNLSIKDVDGELHIISQFTLYADCHHGNRPSFINAAKPEIANELYEKFISFCKEESGLNVETGVFGADMKIDYINDGPITIMLECTKGKIL